MKICIFRALDWPSSIGWQVMPWKQLINWSLRAGLLKLWVAVLFWCREM